MDVYDSMLSSKWNRGKRDDRFARMMDEEDPDVGERKDRGRILNIKYRNVNSYDFKSDRFHKDDELVVIGERE